MAKKKPEISSGSFVANFEASLDNKECTEINCGISLNLKNVPNVGVEKYEIVKDLQNAYDAIKKKYNGN